MKFIKLLYFYKSRGIIGEWSDRWFKMLKRLTSRFAKYDRLSSIIVINTSIT